MEVGSQRQLERRVDLIRRDNRRPWRAAQQVGQLLIAGAHARAGVHDQNRELGVRKRRPRLLAYRARERVALAQVDATGVDQLELQAVPFAGELLAVARDPRTPVHDGLARTREAVDERGLPHVRIADDRDLHGASMEEARRPAVLAGSLILRSPGSRRAADQLWASASRARVATRATTSATDMPVVSSVIDPSAGRSGECARVESRASRSA